MTTKFDSDLSKDWAGTGVGDGVAAHETTGHPLTGMIRDGVVEVCVCYQERLTL